MKVIKSPGLRKVEEASGIISKGRSKKISRDSRDMRKLP